MTYRKVKFGFFKKGEISLDRDNCWLSTLARSERKGVPEEREMIEAVAEHVDDDGNRDVPAIRVVLGDEIFLELSCD